MNWIWSIASYIPVLGFFLIFSLKASGQQVGSGVSADFGGQQSRIVYDDIYSDLDLPVTISAWVKLSEDAGTGRQVLFASHWPENNVYSGVWISAGSNSVAATYGDGMGATHPSFRRSKTAFISGTLNGSWNHFAVVIRGATDFDILLNGQELTGTYSGTGNPVMINAPTGKAMIGFISNNTGDHFYNGQIDELRIWNVSRSINEIRSDMCKRLNGDETGLIGYWRFDEDISLEEVGNHGGEVEGNVAEVTSGAPIGEEEIFEYFSSGEDRKLVIWDEDSIWITTPSNDWIGYHLYKVNQQPNSVEGASLSFEDGYYGIMPVFDQRQNADYGIHILGESCHSGIFRNGNDDSDWEELIVYSDSSLVLTGSEILEFNIAAGDPDLILDEYSFCFGESLSIDAQSQCIESYNWFNTFSEPNIEISVPGDYWLELTTSNNAVMRHEFVVSEIKVQEDYISEESIEVCLSELPIEYVIETDENVNWSTGEKGPKLTITSPGDYWMEVHTECGPVRDSLNVHVSEIKLENIPNAFSPNGDGVNDCFFQETLDGNFTLNIVDRNGLVVYYSETYNGDFCGENLTPGTYFYLFHNKCNLREAKGWVTILK